MRYRKKTFAVEAVQFLGFKEGFADFSERENWVVTAILEDRIGFFGEPNTLDIRTPEGVMRCDKGDYIIKGIQGELYPCKPDIFEASYDVVKEEPTVET